MFKKYKLEKNSSAFTLIEMLVSLSIIMLTALLFILNYQSGNRRTDLIMTAQGLVADIHFVQNNSLGLTPYQDGVPSGGWGISFNKANNTYTIFADLDEPESPGYLQFDKETEFDRDFNCREVTFANGIVIEDLEIEYINYLNLSAYKSVNEVNISFLPPNPVTNIYDVLDDSTGLALIIKLKDNTGSIKSVRLNFLGLAEVID